MMPYPALGGAIDRVAFEARNPSRDIAYRNRTTLFVRFRLFR